MQEKNWDKFSKEIFEQQNKVRVNPKVYIGYLEKCLGRFKGKILYSEDNKSFIETKEGPSAYTEAIEYLRTQRGMPEFKWSPILMKAAKDHVNDIGPKGLVSSMGSNGSLPTDRIAKYGKIDETWAESNIFGGLNAKEVVERLLVCDGQPTRGFRKSLYNDQLHECGIFAGLHKTHDNVIQIEYVKKILKEGEAPSINIQVTDQVPDDVLEKLNKIGVDKSKIHVHKDN